jgi:DHA3 family macrolide efflux protein-like MFS transporter
MKLEKWQKQFYTLWSGQAISQLTSAIVQMAFVWYLTNKTGSAAVLSIATLVGFMPQALFGPFIGVLIDRYDRKILMIVSDLLIALAGLTVVIVAYYSEIYIWLIFIVLAVRSIGAAFHSPSLSAVTPLIVPKEQLTKCAGYSQALQSISYIISPAVAAVLYANWRLENIILIDVVGAIIASITVVLVSIPKLEAKKNQIVGNVLREMKEGYLVLRAQKGLFTLLWIGAVFMLIYMPLNALYPLMSLKYFAGTAYHASVVEIAFASGMLLGGLVLGLWGGFKRRSITIVMSIVIMGASLTVSGFLPSNGFVLFVICCLFMGFAVPFYSAVEMALFQQKIESAYLGRVFSLVGSLVSVSMPLGLILSASFADKVGVNQWFAISGILILGVALVSYLLPAIRHLD